ncbi:MAG TPA: two-component regulator propeller domain-containing protein, partial [Mucilaginibacter sp.]|nr:two-component regulator propeller domain-containing protein [Mucilaginibacter sp.]
MKTSLLHTPLNFLYIAVLLMFGTRLYAQQHSYKIYNVNDGLPSTTTNGVYQDKYGYLWVGTAAGLSRFDGRQFVNYSIADGLPSLGAV